MGRNDEIPGREVAEVVDKSPWESLPVPMYYFAIAALILIAAKGCHPMASRRYGRTGGGGRSSINHSLFTVHYSPSTIHHSPFTIHHF